jgi:hypothetical protein
MNDSISLSVPYERGTQLRDLAVAHGVTVTDAVGLLLDHAARTGLGKLAKSGFDISPFDDSVLLEIDNIEIRQFSFVEARAIANSLRQAATTGGAILDTGCDPMVEISRAGAAVVIQIHRQPGAVLRKAITRGVARAVADRLEEAITKNTTALIIHDAIAGARNVEQMLGDHDHGDDSTSY